jgi:hypothetical protein
LVAQGLNDLEPLQLCEFGVIGLAEVMDNAADGDPELVTRRAKIGPATNTSGRRMATPPRSRVASTAMMTAITPMAVIAPMTIERCR